MGCGLEQTVLYRVLFHHFERFLVEYKGVFLWEYGFFRPIFWEVKERYLELKQKSSTKGASKGQKHQKYQICPNSTQRF